MNRALLGIVEPVSWIHSIVKVGKAFLEVFEQ